MIKSAVLLPVLIILAVAPCAVVSSSDPDASENVWASKTPMQVPRAGLGVAVVDRRIYAIGGFNGYYLDINEVYDPSVDAWVSRKPMMTARKDFGIAVYQNKIYVMGGATGELDHTAVTGVNEVYDPITDSWTRKTPMPTPRQGFQANVVEGKIYCTGGYRLVSQGGGRSTQQFNLNEVYDPETDTWTTKAPLPTAVYGYASAVVNNKIYVIGGIGAFDSIDLSQIYDPITDTWTNGAPVPNAYEYPSGAATTGDMAPKRIYVLGGGSLVTSSFNGIYDPEHNEWSTGASMPTPRSSFGVAVVDDVLYAIGGFAGYAIGYRSANEQYLPVGYGSAPPVVSVLSPEKDITYNASDIPLIFTINEYVSWMGYSLDGQDNVTITGNATLNGLPNGSHNLTVYVTNQYGNMGASEIAYFSVEASEPFPTIPVAVGASAASLAIIGVGLLFYFKRHRQQAEALSEKVGT
jgi:N-acetylneuraminic acid mutarotase